MAVLLSDKDSPSAAVEDYFNAINDKDEAALRSVVCREFQPGDEYLERFLTGLTVEEWDIRKEQINGDKATVTAVYTFTIDESGKSKTQANTADIDLVKEDGSWKYCENF